MASKLIKVQPINIQSWSNNNEVISFSTDKFNVIRAKSETGKSVIFKILYQMVFPNYYKYGKTNDMIRKGCSEAKAIWWLSDGSKVTFFLEHSSQHFEWDKGDGEEPIVYWEKEMPQELIEAFGLIVDYELKIIINVFIKDNPYPFINTPHKWNATLLNKVFANDDMKRALDNLKVWEKEIADYTKQVGYRLTTKQFYSRDLVYTDIDKLKTNFELAKLCNELYAKLDDVESEMNVLNKAHEKNNASKYQMFNIVEINDLKEYFIKLSDTEKALQQLKSAQGKLEGLPKINLSDTDIENDIIGSYKSLFNLCYKLGKEFKNLHTLNNTFKANSDTSEAEKVLKQVDKLKEADVGYRKVYKELKSIHEAMSEYAKHTKEMKVLSAELEETKSKIKICPTCKRPL